MSRLDELIQQYCPDGVEWKMLGELGDFYSGLTGKTKSDFTGGNEKFITYVNVFNNPSLKTDVPERVKIAEGEKQNTIQYGDILFTGSSETPDECGMSSVLTHTIEEKLYLNSFCFGFRFFDLSDKCPSFMKYLFRSTNIRKTICKTANGVTRYNISKKEFAKIEIPIIPLPVQEEIVRILDAFTELQAELQAELQKRKQQYNYYLDNLLNFKNINREGYQAEVRWMKLKDIGKVCMCKRILKSQTSSYGDVPFFKIGTFGGNADAYISQALFNEYKAKYSYPQKGEVLISAAGTIGRTIVFDGTPSYFQDSNIVWLKHDESIVLNSYLRYCYALNPWVVSTGGTIARLYNDNILEATIPVPSLANQQRIVSILDRFDTLTTDLTQGLPAEIEKRRQQYEYYRDKLLTFKRKGA